MLEFLEWLKNSWLQSKDSARRVWFNIVDFFSPSSSNRGFRFEVFTAVTMKNAVFWDVALCRSCVNQRFAVCCHLLTLVARSRIFLLWRWRRYVPPKRWFTQDLHSATSQKTAFFLESEIYTSNEGWDCRNAVSGRVSMEYWWDHDRNVKAMNSERY
jgi:hypothetical protein